jgi:hypothetical protein
METKFLVMPTEPEQVGLAASLPTETALRNEMRCEKLRMELIAEIEAMALFALSDGRQIGQEPAEALARLEQREAPPLPELIALHRHLALVVAPAKPRSILSLQQGQSAGQWANFFGPTPGVRRLTGACLFFAIVFLLISLSGDINATAMSLSIYELSGLPLAIKLGLILSAAGLGATFAALFGVWEDLRNYRYEPLAESASWMQVGLGVVAGLMLAEIIAGEQALGETADSSGAFGGMSEPLLALLGGFSARIIHMVLNNIVNALRRAFGDVRGERHPLEMPVTPYALIDTENPAMRGGARLQQGTLPASHRPAQRAQMPDRRADTQLNDPEL